MNSNPLFCTQCGKSIVSGASFCAYCGSVVKIPSPREVRRSIPIPDRDTLSGTCTVIYTGLREMDVRRVGRLVAEAVGQPLPDVTRAMRTSKGFLASGLPVGRAVALAEKAEQELKEAILVIPDGKCVPLPSAMRMRHAVMDGEGLRCDAYTWNMTDHIAASWDAVFLIACGRLQLEEVVEERDFSATKSGLFGGRQSSVQTHVHHEYLLDIILHDPDAEPNGEGWQRLRLDHNTTGFSLTELKQDPEERAGPLFRSSVNLERFAIGAPMNRGVSLLAAGASDAAWEPLTFLTKRDFDTYTHWLMQLVRYGYPISD